MYPMERNLESEVTKLQMQVDKMMLITEALWILLRNKTGYTDQDLIEMIKNLDISDGVMDNKKVVTQSQPDRCPQCSNMIQKDKSICIFCGAKVTVYPFR